MIFVCLKSRVDLILHPGGLKVIRLFRVFLGVVFLSGNGSQSNGGLKSARDAGGARGVPSPGRVPDLRLRSDPSREPLERPRAAPLGGRAAPEGSAVHLKSR